MACLFGGNGGDYQYRSMLGQFDVMVFCPGRLLNALSRGDTNLHRASYIVVDEADDLLANRAPDIMDNALSQIWPPDCRQFFFFPRRTRTQFCKQRSDIASRSSDKSQWAVLRFLLAKTYNNMFGPTRERIIGRKVKRK